MRQLTVFLAIVWAMCGFRCSAPAADESQARRANDSGCRNVVFILVDDLGWRDVGCFGSTFYETPRVDRLAATGMKFTQAYAACPVCSPTRASILTGKFP